MNKLDYQMINLDASFIGSIDKDQAPVREEHKALFTETARRRRARARRRRKLEEGTKSVPS